MDASAALPPSAFSIYRFCGLEWGGGVEGGCLKTTRPCSPLRSTCTRWRLHAVDRRRLLCAKEKQQKAEEGRKARARGHRTARRQAMQLASLKRVHEFRGMVRGAEAACKRAWLQDRLWSQRLPPNTADCSSKANIRRVPALVHQPASSSQYLGATSVPDSRRH